jgi:hypothetical protein
MTLAKSKSEHILALEPSGSSLTFLYTNAAHLIPSSKWFPALETPLFSFRRCLLLPYRIFFQTLIVERVSHGVVNKGLCSFLNPVFKGRAHFSPLAFSVPSIMHQIFDG